MSDTILILSAHSDDFVFGVGGTAIKYTEEGKRVVSVVFSYGESSHPWLQKEVTREMRYNETKDAIRVMGLKELVFYDLIEGKFLEDAKEKKTPKKLKDLIAHLKPSKIFIHSSDDPHPDHRAVHKMAMKLLKRIKYEKDVYTYNIWNPISVRNRDQPKLMVDISQEFKRKVAALKTFKSQKIALIQLIPATYIRAIKNGWTNRCRYAEIFLKVSLEDT